MLRIIRFLIKVLRKYETKLKGETYHKKWIKGYNEWKKSYK